MYLLQVDEHAQQRLQGLTELYNVADDAKTQHLLLQQAIAYATKANLANLLGPVIKVNTMQSICTLAARNLPAVLLFAPVSTCMGETISSSHHVMCSVLHAVCLGILCHTLLCPLLHQCWKQQDPTRCCRLMSLSLHAVRQSRPKFWICLHPTLAPCLLLSYLQSPPWVNIESLFNVSIGLHASKAVHLYSSVFAVTLSVIDAHAVASLRHC